MAKGKRRDNSEKERLEELARERAKLEAALGEFQRLITVILVNMADTTDFFDRYGDVSGFVRMRRFVETTRVVIAQHGGTLATVAGDKVLAWFDEPEEAVHTAVRLLQKTREQNQLPKFYSPEMHIRIGMNYGPALIKGAEPFGHAVKLAARIQAIAEPDQILLSALLEDKVHHSGFPLRRVSEAAALPGGEQVEIYEVLWREGPGAEGGS